MQSPQHFLTLYDIRDSSQSNGWIPSIWRIRLILNYKRLPYRTVWIDFPDIDRTLRSVNAPSNGRRPDGRAIYTLPVIVDPIRNPSTPVVLSNAAAIAEYLEVAYPARPIYPDGARALQTLFVHYLQEVFSRPLLPIMVPLSHQRLPERSQAHFFNPGQTPHEPYPPGPSREQAWRSIRDNFDFLATIMDKNNGEDGDGDLVNGRDLTYADFALCAILIWIEKVSPQEGWPRIKQWNNGRWSRLMERCRDYMDVL